MAFSKADTDLILDDERKEAYLVQSNFCLWVSNRKQPALRDQPLFSAQHLRTVCLLLLCHLQDWGGLSCQGVNQHKNCHRKK